MQAIHSRQASVSIRPFHELISKSRTPLRSIRCRLRKGFYVKAASVFSADLHGKGIVKAESRTERHAETLFIFALHPLIDLAGFAFRLLLEDCGQCSTRVFRIHIDSSRKHSLM